MTNESKSPKVYGFAPASERPYFIASHGSAPDADYVLLSDYTALEQQRDGLQKRLHNVLLSDACMQEELAIYRKQLTSSVEAQK